jgi:hypothetical protein
MAMKKILLSLSFLATAANSAETDKISEYLVDVNPAPVNAASLIGVTGSAVRTIQTSQDIALAINPLTSKNSKDAFGLSFNPGRANFVPMSGYFYKANQFNKALANITLGYAENSSEISGITYRKKAFAIDTYLYIDPEKDPVMIGYNAFLGCLERKDAQENHRKAVIAATEKGSQLTDEQEKDFTKKETDAQAKCDATAQKLAKWNENRVAVSYGQGHVEKDGSPDRYSLGKFLTITALFYAGDDAGVYLTYQRDKDVLDLKTIGSASQKISSSNLAAARYVRGSGDAALRYLAEISNAKERNSSAQSGVFKYAVGIDKKLSEGIWLLFRYGKSVTVDGDETEKKGILNLSFSAGCLLNQCKAK